MLFLLGCYQSPRVSIVHQTDAVLTGVLLVLESINRPIVGCCFYCGTISPREYQSSISGMLFLLGYKQSPRVSIVHQSDAVFTGVLTVPESINRPLDGCYFNQVTISSESINRPLVGCCFYWGTISPREYQSSIRRIMFLLGYYQSPRVSIIHQSYAVFTGVLIVPESINRPLVGCCFYWDTNSPREYQSSISRMLFLLGYQQSPRVSIVHQSDAGLTGGLLVPESINRPLDGCCFNWGTISPREYQSSIRRMLFLLGYCQSPRVSIVHQSDAVFTGVLLVPESINRPLDECCFYWGIISPREYQSSIRRMLFLLGYYQSPRVAIVHQTDAVFTGVLLVPESINRPLDGCCFNWGTISPQEYQSSIRRMLF